MFRIGLYNFFPASFVVPSFIAIPYQHLLTSRSPSQGVHAVCGPDDPGSNPAGGEGRLGAGREYMYD